jgi:hypothetical protein
MMRNKQKDQRVYQIQRKRVGSEFGVQSMKDTTSYTTKFTTSIKYNGLGC